MNQNVNQPLAARMRPETLSDYIGQKHLLYPGSLLQGMIENDNVPSMILWGPPGTGKTTLASIIAKSTRSRFVTLSATSSGVKDIRAMIKEAQEALNEGRKTILFIDEIHRFNKSQQDTLLPHVESGTITLIGATTENPSFEINSALLSRCRTFILKSLDETDIHDLLEKAMHEGFPDQKIQITDAHLHEISIWAHGDARLALNTLEMIVSSSPKNEEGIITITEDILKQALSKRTLLYDKKSDRHYDMISALHKSMRNSDVDAALYWLARMLEGGEDPLYVARRLVRMASEDIGMADVRALSVCIDAYKACQFLGMPECNVHLAQALTYLCLSPKSNAMEKAYFAARDDAIATMEEPVPLHICNAPTKFMEEAGYHAGYEYSHDYKYHMTDMICVPEKLKGHRYYIPSDSGNEPGIAERIKQIAYLKSLPDAKEKGQP